MSRILPILMIVLLVVLIAAGNVGSGFEDNISTPDGIVQSFYGHVKADDYRKAYALVAPSSNVDFNTMYRDIAGRNGSLKTYSHLQKSETRVVARNGNEAIVRANLTWTTAVGAFHESRSAGPRQPMLPQDQGAGVGRLQGYFEDSIPRPNMASRSCEENC